VGVVAAAAAMLALCCCRVLALVKGMGGVGASGGASVLIVLGDHWHSARQVVRDIGSLRGGSFAVRHRRWNSPKLPLWFLFQQPRPITLRTGLLVRWRFCDSHDPGRSLPEDFAADGCNLFPSSVQYVSVSMRILPRRPTSQVRCWLPAEFRRPQSNKEHWDFWG
jgi:hypothetical protein